MIYRSNRSVGSGRNTKEDKTTAMKKIEPSIPSTSIPQKYHHGENKTSAEILSAALQDTSVKENSLKEGSSDFVEQNLLKSGLPIEDLQRMISGRDEKEDNDRESLRATAIKNLQKDALLRECLEFVKTRKIMDVGAHDVKNFSSSPRRRAASSNSSVYSTDSARPTLALTAPTPTRKEAAEPPAQGRNRS